MPGGGIGGVHKCHLDPIVLAGFQIQAADGQALAGTHADMHLLIPLIGLDADRAAEGCEVTAIRGWMAQHQVIGAAAPQIQLDTEANPIGTDVVQRRIHHA